jgi:rhodanese-related sulfurtransferase
MAARPNAPAAFIATTIYKRSSRASGTARIMAFLAAGLFLAACATTPLPAPAGEVGQVVPVEGGGEYLDILPQELNAMLEGKDFFFVNVHVPYEGEIEQTDAFIPFDQVAQKLSEFPQDRGAKIVLYCRSGSMSAIAAREMVSAGYTDIYNLDGGFRAWEAAGYQLIQSP